MSQTVQVQLPLDRVFEKIRESSIFLVHLFSFLLPFFLPFLLFLSARLSPFILPLFLVFETRFHSNPGYPGAHCVAGLSSRLNTDSGIKKTESSGQDCSCSHRGLTCSRSRRKAWACKQRQVQDVSKIQSGLQRRKLTFWRFKRCWEEMFNVPEDLAVQSRLPGENWRAKGMREPWNGLEFMCV